jgi:hypothetical protein
VSGAETVTVVTPAPFVLRDVVVSAGGVEARADVVEVRTVAEPATVVTLVEPLNVAVVQGGAVALGGTFTHHQLAPAAEWLIPHPLKKRPAVSIQDSAGSLVLGEVRYLSDDLLVVSFLAPFSGRADLN